MIGPSDDNPMKNRAPRRRRGGRGRNGARSAEEGAERPVRGERPARDNGDIVAPGRQVRQFVPRSNPLPMADGATPPQKTESERENTASLYGRIDL